MYGTGKDPQEALDLFVAQAGGLPDPIGDVPWWELPYWKPYLRDSL